MRLFFATSTVISLVVTFLIFKLDGIALNVYVSFLVFCSIWISTRLALIGLDLEERSAALVPPFPLEFLILSNERPNLPKIDSYVFKPKPKGAQAIGGVKALFNPPEGKESVIIYPHGQHGFVAKDGAKKKGNNDSNVFRPTPANTDKKAAVKKSSKKNNGRPGVKGGQNPHIGKGKGGIGWGVRNDGKAAAKPGRKPKTEVKKADAAAKKKKQEKKGPARWQRRSND